MTLPLFFFLPLWKLPVFRNWHSGQTKEDSCKDHKSGQTKEDSCKDHYSVYLWRLFFILILGSFKFSFLSSCSSLSTQVSDWTIFLQILRVSLLCHVRFLPHMLAEVFPSSLAFCPSLPTLSSFSTCLHSLCSGTSPARCTLTWQPQFSAKR